MSDVFVESIGLAAPGLADWNVGRAVLRGETDYDRAPLSSYAPTLLPANEARRATATVRLAFRVAEEAIKRAECPGDSVATVFASSDADMTVSHRICTALSQAQRLVSPTDFHNSVHNAPSGYWHIGAHSQLPSSAVAAHDYSFATGLLETMTQVQAERRPTLLVCYDVPAPEPLLRSRPLAAPFAVALLLTAQRSERSLAGIHIESLTAESSATTLASKELDTLRFGNPAGRALPLLDAIANGVNRSITLERSAQRPMTLKVSVI